MTSYMFWTGFFFLPFFNAELKGLFPNELSISSVVVSNIQFLWEECARLSSLLFCMANILAPQLLQVFVQKIFPGSEVGRGQWKIYMKKIEGKKMNLLLCLPKKKSKPKHLSYNQSSYENGLLTEEVDQTFVQLIWKKRQL